MTAQVEQLPERPTRIRWLIFLLACGTSWFLYLHRYTWNFVAPELERELHWSQLEKQTVYGMFNWTYGFGQVPSVLLCEWMGMRVFLASSICLWAIVVPLHGWLLGTTSISAVRLVFGGAQAGCYPILAKVSHAWFPPSYRTSVQGWIATFCGRSGGALSSIIMGTFLMGILGLSWQSALGVMGLAGVLFAGGFLWLFRDSPEEDPRVNDAERDHIHEGRPMVSSTAVSEKPPIPWRTFWASASLWALLAQQFLVAGADTVFQSQIGSYFLSKGVNIKAAGWLTSLPLWGGAVGGLLGGMFNDALLRAQFGRILRLVMCLGGVLGGITVTIQSPLFSVGLASWRQALPGILAWGVGIGALCGLVVALAFWPIAGRPRWCRSVLGSCSGVVACVGITLLLRQNTLLGAGACLFAIKFFADMQQPTQWGACTDVGGRFSSTVFALVNTAGNFGGVFIPLLVGYVLDLNTTIVNGQKVVSYGPMFITQGVMYTLAASCWLIVDTRKSLDRSN